MKRSLLFKLILCYIICISFIFLIIETLGSFLSKRSFDNYVLNDMSEVGLALTDSYVAPYLDKKINANDFRTKLNNYAQYTNLTIWFVNSRGVISIDTSNNTTLGSRNISEDEPDFLSSSSGTEFYKPGYMETNSYYTITP